jgi:hypothetical protein
VKKKTLKPPSIKEEQVFRGNDQVRAEMAEILANDTFRSATSIFFKKRRNIERLTESLAMGANEVVSVRMNSQRIGIEAFIDFLQEMTEPWPVESQDQPATFGADEQFRKLAEQGIFL